jgi:hypothetical protein
VTDEEFIPDEVRPGRRSRYRFTRTPQWVLLMSQLSDAGYRTYSLLLAHVNTERGDGAVWPRQESLGGMLGKRAEAISRVVNKELVPLGLVDVEPVRYGPNNTRRRNIYTVHEVPPEGWSGFATIQEWYAANPVDGGKTAAQPGHAMDRVSGKARDAKDRSSEDAKNRASGDAKNRAENQTNPELDEEQNEPAPSARSAGDARRASTGSSARDVEGGSAASEKRASSRKESRLTPVETALVAVVERAVPPSLLELLDGQKVPHGWRVSVLRELEHRTAEQLAGRVARRWVRHRYQSHLLAGRGIDKPYAVLQALVRAGECPDAGCEDGELVDTGADCRACQERKARRGASGGVPTQRTGRNAWWECRTCRNPKLQRREPEPEDRVCQDCNREAALVCQSLAARWSTPTTEDVNDR